MMSMSRSKSLLVALAVAPALILAGCSSSSTSLTSVVITPSPVRLTVGGTSQLTLTGTFSDGTRAPVSGASFSSSATTVAVVNSSGVVTGLGGGNATITAEYGGKTATVTAVVTVGPPTLESIAVVPSSVALSVGRTSQLVVSGTYSDGSVLDVTAGSRFATSSSEVATVIATGTSAGLVTGAKNGTATVTATHVASGLVASTTVTVSATAPTLVSVAAVPSPMPLVVGNSGNLTITGTYSDGSQQNLTGACSFVSANTSVATVSSAGLVTAHQQGNVTVTATHTPSGRIATVIVQVTAGPVPVIASFTATPPSILSGGSSTLAWNVTGATSLSIDPGVGTVTGTSVSVSPATTTTYTLTATNGSGIATAQATVTVGQRPVISSFTATPSSITFGSSSLLEWTVTGATSLSLDPGIGTVTGVSRSVSPAETTTYTLSATNDSGTTTATATVTVTAGQGPVIAYFVTSSPVIALGGYAQLTYAVAGATTISIDNGVGTLTGGSPAVVNPTTPTTYTLTAVGASGTSTAMVTVDVVAGLTQMDLPVSFDSATVEYGLVGFEGAQNSMIVVDPAGGTNKVAKVVKAADAQTYAGTTVTAVVAAGAQPGFATPIPFSSTAKTMTVRTWSPNVGIKVRLKVEDHTNPTHSCETEATTTVADGWETLTFDFANPASGTAALDLSFTYDKVSIFFNFGVAGATVGAKTYYFDDVTFVAGSGGGGGGGGGTAPTAAPAAPTAAPANVISLFSATYTGGTAGGDYSGKVDSYNATCFGSSPSTAPVANYTIAGTSHVVKEYTPTTAGYFAIIDLLGPTGGTATPPDSALCNGGGGTQSAGTNVIDVSGMTTLHLDVWSPTGSTNFQVRLVQADANGQIAGPGAPGTAGAGTDYFTGANTIAAGAWVPVDIALSSLNGGPPASPAGLTKVGLIKLFSADAATFYVDNVYFYRVGGGGGGGGGTTWSPITFDSTTVTYTLTDFGGAASSIVNDPAGGTNQVAQVVKTAGAQTWAGTTVSTGTNFSVPTIPLATGSTTMTVRVYSPDVGVPVRLKVENQSNQTISVETEAVTTVANAWETLTFDFANQATGTAPFNPANTYDKMSIFFDFGTAGTGKTYFFDDVSKP